MRFLEIDSYMTVLTTLMTRRQANLKTDLRTQNWELGAGFIDDKWQYFIEFYFWEKVSRAYATSSEEKRGRLLPTTEHVCLTCNTRGQPCAIQVNKQWHLTLHITNRGRVQPHLVWPLNAVANFVGSRNENEIGKSGNDKLKTHKLHEIMTRQSQWRSTSDCVKIKLVAHCVSWVEILLTFINIFHSRRQPTIKFAQL